MSEGARFTDSADPGVFELRGVAYLLQPAGRAVTNLDELLMQMLAADRETVFLHTQMPRLRPEAGGDEPVDDISAWVRGVVQDNATAERLAFEIHSAKPEIDDVRAAIVRVLSSIGEHTRVQHAAPPGGTFVLMRFDAVEVPTGLVARTADELMDMLVRCDRVTWFHHLIEEAWLRPGPIPVVEWLRAAGAPRIAEVLEREATSGRSVDQVRSRTMQRWRRSNIATRLAQAGRDGVSHEAEGRETVGRLARRLSRREPS